MREKLTWALVPLPVLLAVAFFAYAWGIGLLGVSEHGEACQKGLHHEGSPLKEVRTDLWRLTSTCAFEDGATHVEQLTPWVPPLVATSLAGAAASGAIATWAYRRR
ncbi:hypothetical protein LFM09_19320 [Lentzea alba]|uniref:hypothetical protein n=1 Tax=Lentzea alba TaxID=2714351 RepID=UPI0039BFF9B9